MLYLKYKVHLLTLIHHFPSMLVGILSRPIVILLWCNESSVAQKKKTLVHHLCICKFFCKHVGAPLLSDYTYLRINVNCLKANKSIYTCELPLGKLPAIATVFLICSAFVFFHLYMQSQGLAGNRYFSIPLYCFWVNSFCYIVSISQCA
jgi:hypothetical protein